MNPYRPIAERAHCPGCGAALELETIEPVVHCQFCGTPSRILLRLRRAEPELSYDYKPPQSHPDPEHDPRRWSFEQLLTALHGDHSLERKIELARALDNWPHARPENACWLPALLKLMGDAPAELDRALAGVIGKMICSDDLELKRAVLDFGWAHAFAPRGTPGLLFALSLGDAATVKLLLEVGDQASRRGNADYSLKALQGVRTAIGRERHRRVDCTRVLLYRFLELSRPVQEFVTDFLRHQFDVGYTDHLPETVEVLEDCLGRDLPELAQKLKDATRKCGRPKDQADLESRLALLRWARSETATGVVLSCIEPPYPCAPEQVELAVRALLPFQEHPEAQRALKRFVWEGQAPAPVFDQLELPAVVREELERRRS